MVSITDTIILSSEIQNSKKECVIIHLQCITSDQLKSIKIASPLSIIHFSFQIDVNNKPMANGQWGTGGNSLVKTMVDRKDMIVYIVLYNI